MGVEYREEDMLAVWDEFLPLFRANYDGARDYLDFNLDREHYAALKEMNVLRMYTVRVDGAPAGYALFTVAPSPHLAHVLHAFHDALFILPEHRIGHRGATLITYAEEQLRALGVVIVYQHTKPGRDHGPLLLRLGYLPVETVHAKRLDGG